MEISPASPSTNTLAPQTSETNASSTTTQNQTPADFAASLPRTSQTGSSIETGEKGARAKTIRFG
ncbi:hypothetical protein PAN31117_02347 [Pandoraea anapnoica]|uniref:Uncharacterized protein n=2 Tax=Pandoraea anapnoica TaxID=2508301 RepID=A0A5E5A3E8_9BURK|nr:hypothetical protein PAN31117_02347 [Pandoraea anapnoica]